MSLLTSYDTVFYHDLQGRVCVVDLGELEASSALSIASLSGATLDGASRRILCLPFSDTKIYFAVTMNISPRCVVQVIRSFMKWDVIDRFVLSL